MGYWLIAAIVLQLACAFCAAKLDRPAVWLQFILLVPVLGALAFCLSEASRAFSAVYGAASPAPGHDAARSGAALGGFGYRAVSARTTKSRRALAEECAEIGRHADARLLFESCGEGANAEDSDAGTRAISSRAGLDRAAGPPGDAD